jgi:hypothetical protein
MHPFYVIFGDVKFPIVRRLIYYDGYSHFVSPKLCIFESEMIRKLTCVMVVAYVGIVLVFFSFQNDVSSCKKRWMIHDIFSSYAALNYDIRQTEFIKDAG